MKNKQNLVFRLEKQQLPYYDECHNWLAFEEIEIIEFNYDGKGNASGYITKLFLTIQSKLFNIWRLV